jgi:hypothetical protein
LVRRNESLAIFTLPSRKPLRADYPPSVEEIECEVSRRGGSLGNMGTFRNYRIARRAERHRQARDNTAGFAGKETVSSGPVAASAGGVTDLYVDPPVPEPLPGTHTSEVIGVPGGFRAMRTVNSDAIRVALFPTHEAAMLWAHELVNLALPGGG